ncbi:alpha/beta hydrolase family protein [Polaribacter sp. Asnod1-A03]|uniref:alpha/beta hydrolase family protein n=1 Tax=Polaribacter sp. Asnod1-A03 TaxID=3160581 RepID=UPI003864FCDD
MRFLEIILLLLCFTFITYLSIRKGKTYKKIELGIILLVPILHLTFEGFRWQMIPIYILLCIISFWIYKEYLIFKGNWIKKSLTILGITTLMVLGYVLPTILPIFELPKPTGKYSIGSQYIHLKTDREETITKNPTDKRELMIKVWYPANIKNEKKEPYLNDGDRVSFASKYGLPKSTFDYLNHIKTNTFLAPKIANGKFPVLIFSHGSYSKASGYYAILEEIASHGYIILNINHTYESTGTLFPDGSIKLYNQEYDNKHISTQKMAELAWKSQQDYNNAKNEKERFDVSQNILKNYIAADISKRWSKDIISVIDELQNLNQKTFLTNHLDISKIGVVGHSQGGAAIGQAILDDDRISAGINLDGVQWGNMIDKKLSKPFLLISSDWKPSHPNFNKYAYKNGSTSVFYDAKIRNSGHASFMDIPLMINIPVLNEGGTINKKEATKIINKNIISFFDIYLKSKKNDLLKLKEEFSSLEISRE